MNKILTVVSLSCCALVLAWSGRPAFAQSAAPAVPANQYVTKLEITDTKLGNGAVAVADKQVTVHYTGWLYSPNSDKPGHKGMKFFSSLDSGFPQTFKLGTTGKIKGLSQGITGMKVGGTRTLLVPPELGYGARGLMRGTVPSNAPLVYEVELLDVR
jgi:FKBP-type peptidyl-prolyl cis-trans isomerase FkpA